MTGLDILMIEMPHSRLTTPPLPVAWIPPGVPAEQAVADAEQALALLLRPHDDAVARLTPWLDAHPAPEGDSAHARIESKRWEEAHRAARDAALPLVNPRVSTPDLFILHLEIADEDDGFEPPADSILLFALPAGTDTPEAARRIQALHDALAAHYEAWSAKVSAWRASNPMPRTPSKSDATAHQRAALATWFDAHRSAQKTAWQARLGRPLSPLQRLLTEAVVSRPRDVAVQIRAQRLPQAPAEAFLP